MREIIEVPFPLAASRRFISFLTFQISIYYRCRQSLFLNFVDGRDVNSFDRGATHDTRKEEGHSRVGIRIRLTFFSASFA
jgi:hypothetical protein